VWHVTRAPFFTITTITAEGGVTIEPAEVTERVEPVLAGTYLGLIPRRFTYMYPAEAVVNAVLAVPRIKDVTVSRADHDTIKVEYDEYVPQALWCKDRETSACYFLDEAAYAFGPAPDLKGGSLLRYYTPETDPAIGPAPFSVADYEATDRFAAALALTGWFVSGVEIDSVRDVFYTLVGGGELKASLLQANETTLEYLNTLRTSDEYAHLTPDNFSYIDLRFGTKLFVNEVTVDENQATTTDEVSAVATSTLLQE
jgi:hypothetical protein